MSTLTVAEAREHFADLCTSVATTGEPVIIQREGQPNVMIVSEDALYADDLTTSRILGGGRK